MGLALKSVQVIETPIAAGGGMAPFFIGALIGLTNVERYCVTPPGLCVACRDGPGGGALCSCRLLDFYCYLLRQTP